MVKHWIKSQCDNNMWAFWRPKKFSGVTDGGAAVSAANIQQYMTALAIQMVRGNNKTDLIVTGNDYFAMYVNSLQAIQRISSEGSAAAGAGFASLKYFGAGMASDVVLDGGIGSPYTATGAGGTGGTNANWTQPNTGKLRSTMPTSANTTQPR